MANEVLSHGTILEVETSAGPPIVYTAVGGVEGFPIPSIIRDRIEVTALDSVAREYIAALPDTGQSAFTLMLRKGTTAPNYEAGQQRLETLAGSGAIVSFRVTLPPAFGTIRYTANGFVQRFEVLLQTGDAAKAAVEIQWTGGVTKS